MAIGGFPGGSVVKSLPAKQETWVQSLGQEDSLEKEMATHSSILFFFFVVNFVIPGPSACLMHPTWAGNLFHP